MAEKRDRGLRYHLPSAPFVIALAAIVAVAAGAFIYFGAYNIGADEPHTPLVYSVLDQFRQRSIAVRAKGINPPDLNSATRIATGAGLYTEMCSGCHLGPGIEPSEMSQGLYPQAPQLARFGQRLSAGEQFWIIKHGVKLSAMPAWGKTHPDPLIWDMVAFVRKLPGMTAEQYKTIVASAPADHDEMMKDMPAMKNAMGMK